MVPKKHEGVTQLTFAGDLATARLQPISAQPLSAAVYQRSRPISVRKAVISIAVIDEKSFTRECITTSLQALDDRLDIMSFTTCDDCLQHIGSHDLILYHTREDVANWSNNNEQFLSFKKLLNIVPVIILSDIDCPDSLIEMFENGVRGFIPTDNTTLEQLIEIIGLVKAGGIFVPLSSLSLRRTKAQGVSARRESDQFTPAELAVLDRLKLGKANKIIAHELGVSESTVKGSYWQNYEETEGHKSDASRVPRLCFDRTVFIFPYGGIICLKLSDRIRSHRLYYG
jgi:DNA-binding NarL/FixJ family response regulator